MRVAYLVNQYPGISHSFIRREIQALERAGVEIRRFSIRRAKAGIIAPEDEAEARLTRVILAAAPREMAGACVASILAAPGPSLAALLRALVMGRRSEAGLARHCVYWIEALVLAAWLRAENLAHVHAHFGTNSATVALLAARIARAGFSMTVHGPEEFDKPALIALPQKIRESRFTAAVSSFGMSQLRRLVDPSLWSRIAIVRCGIEPAFHAGALAPPPAAPRLVSIGRLSAQKGQLTLIEAAALLKQKGRRFEIVLIGDGEMRDAIKSAADRAGLAEEIRFAGWKTPQEVRAALLDARALVLPSYAEGLPVSIMEAFSLNRPVITTYVAGIPELVAPGENGWLAPPGDAASLAAAMEAALDCAPERLETMGRAGAARVRRDHDIDAIAAGLKRLFERAAHEAS